MTDNKTAGEADWARFCHIDGDPCDLRQTDHNDDLKVLAEVRRLGRFSSFDMTQTLWDTLVRLRNAGKIVEIPAGYPVIIFRMKELAA